MLTDQSGPSGQICLTFSNAKVSVNLAILHPLTINCHPVSCIYDGIRQVLTHIIPILGNICKRVANFRYGALVKKILLKLSVRVEVSSVESNETTAATPPPQRQRRRHPPPPPPRNLPFVTFQGSKETYLSLHNLSLSHRKLTGHDPNWTELQQVDPVHDVFTGHARQHRDLIGCSETRTVGARPL